MLLRLLAEPMQACVELPGCQDPAAAITQLQVSAGHQSVLKAALPAQLFLFLPSVFLRQEAHISAELSETSGLLLSDTTPAVCCFVTQAYVQEVVGEGAQCWRLKRVLLRSMLQAGLRPASSSSGGGGVASGRWVQQGVHIPSLGQILKPVCCARCAFKCPQLRLCTPAEWAGAVAAAMAVATIFFSDSGSTLAGTEVVSAPFQHAWARTAITASATCCPLTPALLCAAAEGCRCRATGAVSPVHQEGRQGAAQGPIGGCAHAVLYMLRLSALTSLPTLLPTCVLPAVPSLQW